jgi:CheY-like chemotaxis protein
MEKDCSDGACRSGHGQPDDARPATENGYATPPRLVRSGCPLKVLIVEDDMIVAYDIAAMVEEQGGRVVGIATDSRQAIELGLAHYPDIVVMDVILRADSDGIHAAEVIQDLVGSAIVFCTASADPTTQRRMDAVPGAVIVHKPILSIELSAAIAKVLQTDARLAADRSPPTSRGRAG